jgi:hypothetical protein
MAAGAWNDHGRLVARPQWSSGLPTGSSSTGSAASYLALTCPARKKLNVEEGGVRDKTIRIGQPPRQRRGQRAAHPASRRAEWCPCCLLLGPGCVAGLSRQRTPWQSSHLSLCARHAGTQPGCDDVRDGKPSRWAYSLCVPRGTQPRRARRAPVSAAAPPPPGRQPRTDAAHADPTSLPSLRLGQEKVSRACGDRTLRMASHSPRLCSAS